MVNDTLIILQARMASERLPGKVMKLIDGIPMIGHQIERLKWSGFKIVLTTSINSGNDALVEYAKQKGIDVYRGSEDNVLQRFYEAASEFNARIVIRVTGDNPLIDGHFIKEAVLGVNEFHSRLYLSPGKSETFPLGMSCEAFRFSLLKKAYQNASNVHEKEHVTPYMHQNVPGDIEIVSIKNEENNSNLRLTVDTQHDFDLIRILIEEYQCSGKKMKDIISLLTKLPELISINKNVVQKRWNEV